MSWVVAPWKPRSAKTRAAASMISGSRRRGLGRERREDGRVTTVMALTCVSRTSRDGGGRGLCCATEAT